MAIELVKTDRLVGKDTKPAFVDVVHEGKAERLEAAYVKNPTTGDIQMAIEHDHVHTNVGLKLTLRDHDGSDSSEYVGHFNEAGKFVAKVS